MFIIFDLDGTLADVTHRRPLLDPPQRNWDAFFAACGDDAPIRPIITVARDILAAGGHRIEIWSGRSDKVRAETEEWLGRYGLDGVPLRMRPNGDNTPDDQLKEMWLLAEDAAPDMVFDDRDKVVAMWRRHGILCAQVAPGDF